MKISEMLKNKRTVSFEFFPPKKEEGENVLYETIKELVDYKPDFVSVTYGAGGSTREKTVEWTTHIKKNYGLTTMMHLTCVAADANSIDAITDAVDAINVKNLLALRGDYPADMPEEQRKGEFRYAADLVGYLRKKHGDKYCLGVAGYPEKHPEASSMQSDIENMKRKLDAGGDFIITQLFFDNDHYFRYMDILAKNGINAPVVAGIMPIINIAQVVKFTQMCGATVPQFLVEKMDGKSEKNQFMTGVEYAVEQCRGLIDAGVAGLHFYTLNKHGATEAVLDRTL
ncbi:methylenetetrahydrofolate reductase [NAD(P)H] [Seleniivibrio woodruffii]|uniref:Methylenetetrahydrofolate reductase n=1 Tax=Seleniivibrio woodruffii TaxID=1078050 RepID=A0A4R1KEW0_9BACT|nr:methylenetetrahydrofolate reductase [NAD(P)H] [Seleniivibrio woodruffii]TCK62687.1 5,10-methylenetetrahydrofolate reductase (NAD(P)) [Seleniivibrio woodruffii]TVZ36888.1 5,10-methylenetetrahydrofolate reductase (NAD(P)) [Seleniivibrio woodruffii]